MIGYPFINPGPVGGKTNLTSLPDMELFVRWWQLATFLPQLHFLTPPVMYRDQGIAPVGRKLKAIRDNVVNPLLVKVAADAMDSSLPLIRPLWMLNPHDEKCLVISDQFLLGDQLMVAPVLEPGLTQRTVYLPSSADGDNIVWKRGTDGPYYEGGQTLDIAAPLDEVIYFQRMSDKARPGLL